MARNCFLGILFPCFNQFLKSFQFFLCNVFQQNSSTLKEFLLNKSAFTLDAKRRLATFASGRLHHLLQIGQPFINICVSVKLSKRLRSLRPVETFRKLLMTSNFWLLRVRFKRNLIHKTCALLQRNVTLVLDQKIPGFRVLKLTPKPWFLGSQKLERTH